MQIDQVYDETEYIHSAVGLVTQNILLGGLLTVIALLLFLRSARSTLVIALAILHWDFWWWDSATLVFGFIPIGLAYHALFSIACAVTWWAVSRFAWPEHLERWAAGAGGVDANTDGGEGDS